MDIALDGEVSIFVKCLPGLQEIASETRVWNSLKFPTIPGGFRLIDLLCLPLKHLLGLQKRRLHVAFLFGSKYGITTYHTIVSIFRGDEHSYIYSYTYYTISYYNYT